MRSVRFQATGDDPTLGGTRTSRTLSWSTSDGLTLSDEQTTTVTVTAVHDAPSGTNKAVSSLRDTVVTLYTADFGFADTLDGGAHALAAVRISSLPAAGTLRHNNVAITAAQVGGGFEVSAADVAAGRLTFLPAAGASGNGHASFTFQVRDDGGTANGGVNLDPSANTITFDVGAAALLAAAPLATASLAAAPGGVAAAKPAAATALRQSDLNAIKAAAVQRWQKLGGLTAKQVTALKAVSFSIANLTGQTLGRTSGGNRVVIDNDAGGRGWYVDTTPADDKEFAVRASATRLYAKPAAAPAGRMDLLTAVMHEMGHVLRLGQADGDREGLMFDARAAGERRLPRR